MLVAVRHFPGLSLRNFLVEYLIGVHIILLSHLLLIVQLLFVVQSIMVLVILVVVRGLFAWSHVILGEVWLLLHLIVHHRRVDVYVPKLLLNIGVHGIYFGITVEQLTEKDTVMVSLCIFISLLRIYRQSTLLLRYLTLMDWMLDVLIIL